MGLQKQAKILSKHQQITMLRFLDTTRYPERNKVIFLLSIKAGLRAKEIAHITWSMVTDSNGQIADKIHLEDSASKGRSGGVIWMNNELQDALSIYFQSYHNAPSANDRIIKTERRQSTSSQNIINIFRMWYLKLGFDGCSSHSGRRTFITNSARKISTVAGSIKDVQMLARH